MFATFIAHARARHSLKALLSRKGDHLLRDIGIDPAEAQAVLDGGSAPWVAEGAATGPVTLRVLPRQVA